MIESRARVLGALREGMSATAVRAMQGNGGKEEKGGLGRGGKWENFRSGQEAPKTPPKRGTNNSSKKERGGGGE